MLKQAALSLLNISNYWYSGSNSGSFTKALQNEKHGSHLLKAIESCTHKSEAWSSLKKVHILKKRIVFNSTILFNCFKLISSFFFLASDQVPLIEDLEQIFMRSWRESHLSEIRQYQQAIPQTFPQVPSQIAPVTSAQLPWLAGLAASSCNDSVHIIECSYSLAEGLSEMFKLLIEGKLIKTNYVVIICASRNRAIDSCIVITGKIPKLYLQAKHSNSMLWGVG